MYIIMLGAPGTGKGTIGIELCKKYNLEHISTGDIFRDEIKKQTELGQRAEEYISKGKLVPDEITISMVEGKLDNLSDVLLDGFPRTIEQAEALKNYLHSKNESVTAVINLMVPDEDLILRTSSRVTCSNKECGATFNTVFMPPKKEGICDKCGSELVKRKDDNAEMIKKRLEEYYKNTEPLIEYYEKSKLLDTININIYLEDVKQDTTNKAILKIDEKINK